MTYRITDKHLQGKVDIVNGLIGHADAAYSTVGAIVLYSAYGGTAVHRYSNEHGGVSDLLSLGTKRECALFLDGMIQALRIASES